MASNSETWRAGHENGCRMYGLFQPPMGDDSTCHGGLVLHTAPLLCSSTSMSITFRLQGCSQSETCGDLDTLHERSDFNGTVRSHDSSMVLTGYGGRYFGVYAIPSSQTFFSLSHDSPQASRDSHTKKAVNPCMMMVCC